MLFVCSFEIAVADEGEEDDKESEGGVEGKSVWC